MAGNGLGGLKYLGLFTQLGLVMTLSVGIGAAVGHYIDQLLKTGAVFTIIFLLIGIAAGFKTAYQLIIELDKDEGGQE